MFIAVSLSQFSLPEECSLEPLINDNPSIHVIQSRNKIKNNNNVESYCHSSSAHGDDDSMNNEEMNVMENYSIINYDNSFKSFNNNYDNSFSAELDAIFCDLGEYNKDTPVCCDISRLEDPPEIDKISEKEADDENKIISLRFLLHSFIGEENEGKFSEEENPKNKELSQILLDIPKIETKKEIGSEDYLI